MQVMFSASPRMPVASQVPARPEQRFVRVARVTPVLELEPARARTWSLTVPVPAILGVAWFAAALAGILWMWGGQDPRYFPSPDESVNRRAAQLVADYGRPDLVRGSLDPEDLRHGRTWISIDEKSIPAYPPLPYYVQAGLLKAPFAGALLVPALSALGIAALVAGLATLGGRRRWAAGFAPLIAFPALYWMMRPWMNMATLLSFASITFFCWAQWRRTGQDRWLLASTAMLSLTAAMRPDYALLVLAVGLLSTLAVSPRGELKRIVLCLACAAVAAVGINLLLNAMTTGSPLKAAYEIWGARRADAAPASAGFGITSKFGALLLPEGKPTLALLRDQFTRYGIQMGPIALVLVAQLALVPLLWRSSRPRIALIFALIAVVVLFMMSRVSADVFGGSNTDSVVRHSVPRYWTLAYLIAAIPPVLLIMRETDARLWISTAALCGVIALFGAREIYNGQPESMLDIRSYETAWASQIDSWRREIPPDAVVYSARLDKVLWSEWDVATYPQPFDPDRLASSIERTIADGYSAYIIETQWNPWLRVALDAALGSRGLSLEPSRSADVYAVRRDGAPIASMPSADTAACISC